MKNTLRILSMIAMSGAALAASASPTFAAANHRTPPAARKAKPSVMKRKNAAGKKVVINLERPGPHKIIKSGKKTGALAPVISHS